MPPPYFWKYLIKILVNAVKVAFCPSNSHFWGQNSLNIAKFRWLLGLRPRPRLFFFRISEVPWKYGPKCPPPLFWGQRTALHTGNSYTQRAEQHAKKKKSEQNCDQEWFPKFWRWCYFWFPRCFCWWAPAFRRKVWNKSNFFMFSRKILKESSSWYAWKKWRGLRPSGTFSTARLGNFD